MQRRVHAVVDHEAFLMLAMMAVAFAAALIVAFLVNLVAQII